MKTIRHLALTLAFAVFAASSAGAATIQLPDFNVTSMGQLPGKGGTITGVHAIANIGSFTSTAFAGASVVAGDTIKVTIKPPAGQVFQIQPGYNFFVAGYSFGTGGEQPNSGTTTLSFLGVAGGTISNVSGSGPGRLGIGGIFAAASTAGQPSATITATGVEFSFTAAASTTVGPASLANFEFYATGATTTPHLSLVAGSTPPANSAPTDIALSASTLAENNAPGATVGTLSATDADAGQTHTFSLVSGTGSTDNVAFTIAGNTLSLNASADFETQSSYAIRIRATDSGAGSLTYEEQFTITITDVTYPQTISFTNPGAHILGDAPFALSASGGGSGNAVTFSIQSGPATVSGSTLTITGAGDVTVRASQAGGGDYDAAADVDQTFTVSTAGGPVLVDDAAFAGSTAITINVLANDSPGATLTSVTQPASGGVAAVVAGKVTFTPSALVSAPITFTYTAGNGVSTSTATVTVLPRTWMAGNFVGLLRRGDGTIRGRVTLMVASTGAVTGSVRREGSGYAFKGSIGGEGLMGRATTAVLLPTPMTVVPGPLDTIGQPTLVVRLPDTAPGAWLEGTAERSPYSTSNLAPQAGRYTIVADLPPGGAGPQTAAAMTCLIASNGLVTMGGKHGSAIGVTQGGRLLHGGRLPFYVSTGVGAAMQSLGGELVIDPAGTPDVTGTLRWVVPAGTPRLSAGVAQDYDAIGQAYVPAALPSGMFSPAAPTATLTMTAPSLGAASPVVRTVGMNGLPSQGLRQEYFSGGRVDLFVNRGLFTGMNTMGGVTRNFYGVVLQGGGINAGQGNLLEPTSLQPVTFAP